MAERNTKRLLWGVLGGLAGIIILLVVGIIVVKINTDQEPENTYPATIHTPELSKLNEEAAKLSIEEAKALYEAAINNATTELERERTRVEYGRYLMGQDLTEEGLNKLLATDDSVLGAAYKMLLYAALRDYFGGINNDELFSKYNNMISEAIVGSEYEAGG